MTWFQRQIDGLWEAVYFLRWQEVVRTLVGSLLVVMALSYGWYGFIHFVIAPMLDKFARAGSVWANAHHPPNVQAPCPAAERHGCAGTDDRAPYSVLQDRPWAAYPAHDDTRIQPHTCRRGDAWLK